MQRMMMIAYVPDRGSRAPITMSAEVDERDDEMIKFERPGEVFYIKRRDIASIAMAWPPSES